MESPSSTMSSAGGASGDKTTPRERKGWYMYDWANSAISSVAISGFLPLLLQETALAAAGYPGICGNYLANATLAESLFPGGGYSGAYTFNDQAAWDDGLVPNINCLNASAPQFTGIWCPGAPPSASECLTSLAADAGSRLALSVTTGGRAWEPSAYSSAMISVSTGLQMVVFVAIGGLADYGRWRKTLLVLLSLFGSLVTILCVTVTPANWWAGGLLMVLVNISYGASYVVYNAFLPSLAAGEPEVLEATPAARDGAFTTAIERISSYGMATG